MNLVRGKHLEKALPSQCDISLLAKQPEVAAHGLAEGARHVLSNLSLEKLKLVEVVNHLGCNWHHAYPERLDVVDAPLVASNLARL